MMRTRAASYVRLLTALVLLVAGLALATSIANARRAGRSGGGSGLQVPPTVVIDPTRVSALQTRMVLTLEATPSPRTPPPEFFQTATRDLRPTPTLDFVAVHRWTDAGVIVAGPPDAFAVCFRSGDRDAPWIVNAWIPLGDPENPIRIVYAGAVGEGEPPKQGALLVSEGNPCEWEEYQTPLADGPMEIIAAVGHELALSSDGGRLLVYFNLDRRVFVPAFATPTPGPTPTQWKSPPLALDEYAVVGRTGVVLGPKVLVAGSVAVSGDVRGILDVKQDVHFDAYSVLTGPAVRIGPAVFLPGDVFANTLSKNPTAVILGSFFPTVGPGLLWPAFPEFSLSPNSPRLIVPAKDEDEARPGDYEEITVRSGATLVLTGGVYEVRSLRIEAGAQVICAEESRLCELRVVDSVRLGKDASLRHRRPDLGASGVVVYVRGSGGLLAENGSILEANVYAPAGAITLGPNGTYTGSFLGAMVDVKGGSTVSLDSGFESSP